jgi:hypothetical protein
LVQHWFHFLFSEYHWSVMVLGVGRILTTREIQKYTIRHACTPLNKADWHIAIHQLLVARVRRVAALSTNLLVVPSPYPIAIAEGTNVISFEDPWTNKRQNNVKSLACRMYNVCHYGPPPAMDYPYLLQQVVNVEVETLVLTRSCQVGRKSISFILYWPNSNYVMRRFADLEKKKEQKNEGSKCYISSTSHSVSSSQQWWDLFTWQAKAWWVEK